MNLGVSNYSKKLYYDIENMIEKNYEVEKNSLHFYFPFIDFFQDDNPYEFFLNNKFNAIDIYSNIESYDEKNEHCWAKISSDKFEYLSEVVIKKTPIISFEDFVILQNHLKQKMSNIIHPNQINEIINKLNDCENPAYMDTMGSYLTSKLTEDNICPSFPLFYGYNLFTEKQTTINITNDLDNVSMYNWFRKNKNVNFKISKQNNSCNLKKKDYFAHVDNYPVHLKIMEYVGEETRNGIYNFKIKEWKSIIFQIIFALYIIQKYYNLHHNDLHLGNVLFKETGIEHYYYRYNDQYFKIPTYGYTVKIIDWNRCTFEIGDFQFYNNCFRQDGIASGQFILPDRKYKSPNPFFPNNNTDLAILSYSILKENLIEPESELYTFLKNLSTNEKNEVIHEHYEDFESYVECAKCKNAVPEKYILDSIFNEYKIEKSKIPKTGYIYQYTLKNTQQ